MLGAGQLMLLPRDGASENNFGFYLQCLSPLKERFPEAPPELTAKTAMPISNSSSPQFSEMDYTNENVILETSSSYVLSQI